MAALHHEMREKPYQANRTLGVVSKMMNQAEAWGLRPDRSNPCYHVRKLQGEEARAVPDGRGAGAFGQGIG